MWEQLENRAQIYTQGRAWIGCVALTPSGQRLMRLVVELFRERMNLRVTERRMRWQQANRVSVKLAHNNNKRNWYLQRLKIRIRHSLRRGICGDRVEGGSYNLSSASRSRGDVTCS